MHHTSDITKGKPSTKVGEPYSCPIAYPIDMEVSLMSIEMKDTCQLVKEMVIISECNWESVDYGWAFIFLTLTLSPSEIVD